MRSPRSFFLLALLSTVAFAPLSTVAGQGSPADSVHAKQAKDTLAAIRKRTTSATIRRQVDWLVARENALLVPPKDTTTPPPQPLPVPTTTTLTAPSTTLLQGKTAQVSAVVTDQNGAAMSGVPLLWKAGDSTILSVSTSGVATGRKAGQGVVWATPTNALGAAGSLTITVQDTAITPPIPPIPPSGMIGPVAVAALPVSEPKIPYPTQGRAVKVCATCSLQAALNNAQGGDIILTPPDATYVGNFTLPAIASASASAPIVVRTDTSLSTSSRMTPSASVHITKIVTPNYSPAIGTNPGAHDWRLAGLEFLAQSAVPEVNMLVRIGDATTSHANVPQRIVLDRVYIHGNPTLNAARCVLLNAYQSAVVDSWVSGCRYAYNGKHSQEILGYSGTEQVLIQNNHLEGGHEVIVFGGADNPDDTYTPKDITIRGNHITRPLTSKKVDPDANQIETKNVRRLLIEGNVIENNWADVQDGAAIVLKSENQTGAAPWSQTADVTIRYNVIRCVGKAFRFAGHGSNSSPSILTVTAARITVYDNVVTDLNVAPCDGADGTPLQVQAGVTDVALTHNTMLNPATGYGVLLVDPSPTFAMHSNLYGRGGYGALRTGGITEGTASITARVTSWLYQSNVVLGSGFSCSLYPATTTCAASVPATLPLGYDGRVVGADTAAVNAATRNAVVAP